MQEAGPGGRPGAAIQSRFCGFYYRLALCGLAGNASQLIGFRLVQGAGAALMVVNSAAIITEVFPPYERGRALGINGVTWAAGGVIGPVLGGFILTVANWRWIFFINVPIGILGALWGYLALREVHRREQHEKFDPLAGTFSLGLIAILLALTLGIQFSWTSPPILMLFVAFVVLLAIFLWWERRARAGHAGDTASGSGAGVVQPLDADDALLADRRGTGTDGIGRRAVLFSQHQCGHERGSRGTAGDCLRHARHAAPGGHGNQFRAVPGGGGRCLAA